MEMKDFQDFKEQKISAKSIFTIAEIDKKTCYEFIRKYHYLGDAKFFCVHGFGLYYKGKNGNEIVGCATYSNPQGVSALKGWFGLENDCQYVLELSRLCLLPCLNGTNATSFLLGNSIKMLKKYCIKAVITLADSSRHVGSIYQVCNFKYYGLTDAKTDFYSADGFKNPRGKTADKHGVWIERTRKHRYCYLIDKKIVVNYKEMKYPTKDEKSTPKCCSGLGKVYDKRFDEWYTCPVCCGYIQLLNGEDAPKVEIKNAAQQHKEDKQLFLLF